MFKYTKEGTQKPQFEGQTKQLSNEKGQTDKNVDKIKV